MPIKKFKYVLKYVFFFINLFILFCINKFIENKNKKIEHTIGKKF